ncbi:Long-chain-fatty-acid--CoA ligase [Geobacillus sp. WSUCF1]|nr:Long-chain-fatty-acid--CoA ligase [Geobacillus sp. WSUCF1]
MRGQMPNMAEDIVEHAAVHYGKKIAIIDGEHALSFVEVNERSLRLAERLRDLGVQKGDAVQCNCRTAGSLLWPI